MVFLWFLKEINKLLDKYDFLFFFYCKDWNMLLKGYHTLYTLKELQFVTFRLASNVVFHVDFRILWLNGKCSYTANVIHVPNKGFRISILLLKIHVWFQCNRYGFIYIFTDLSFQMPLCTSLLLFNVFFYLSNCFTFTIFNFIYSG